MLCCTSKAEALQKCSFAMTKLATMYVGNQIAESELYQRRDEMLKVEKVVPANSCRVGLALTCVRREAVGGVSGAFEADSSFRMF